MVRLVERWQGLRPGNSPASALSVSVGEMKREAPRVMFALGNNFHYRKVVYPSVKAQPLG
jgi:hypothetical protein